MRKLIFAMLLLLFAASAICAMPFTYSAGPTEGTVIAAETKKPVVGAVVIAIWDLEGGMEGGNRIATLKVAEAVTDGDGHYRIPGWGPVPRPPKGILDSYDPAILIFKSGYLPRQLLNDTSGTPGKRMLLEVHDSIWNGKTVALAKYDGDLKLYSRKVDFILESLQYVMTGKDCSWKQIPKTFRALEEERKREIAAGIKPSFGPPARFPMARQECAPIDEFKEAYGETN